MGANHTYRYVNTGGLVSTYGTLKSGISRGSTVSGALKGTTTRTGYGFKVMECYRGLVSLIGASAVATVKGYLSPTYTWTITFAENTITNKRISISNCTIPYSSDVAGIERDHRCINTVYWLNNTFDSGAIFRYTIDSNGLDNYMIDNGNNYQTAAVVPFVRFYYDYVSS